MNVFLVPLDNQYDIIHEISFKTKLASIDRRMPSDPTHWRTDVQGSPNQPPHCGQSHTGRFRMRRNLFLGGSCNEGIP